MALADSMEKKEVEAALARAFDYGPFTWEEMLGGFSSRNFALRARNKQFVLKQFGPAAARHVKKIEAIAVFLQKHHFSAPIAEATRAGKRYFECHNKLYALYARSSGVIRHNPGSSDMALRSIAEKAAELHLLGTRATEDMFGPLRRRLHRDALSLTPNEIFIATADKARLPKKDTDTLLESLNLKRELIKNSNYDECASLNNGGHFVHGDFHHENMLFDTHAKVNCVLDFEESHLGQGICDIVNFVFMALCKTGLSTHQLDTGRRFIGYYRSIIPTENWLVAVAIRRYFLSMASSTFLEERLVEGQLLFTSLLQRDLAKMKIWKKEARRIVRALGATAN